MPGSVLKRNISSRFPTGAGSGTAEFKGQNPECREVNAWVVDGYTCLGGFHLSKVCDIKLLPWR